MRLIAHPFKPELLLVVRIDGENYFLGACLDIGWHVWEVACRPRLSPEVLTFFQTQNRTG